MPRYKSYDYGQLMMVPVSLADQLVPGTLEHAIHHVIEEDLDTSIFDEKYRNDETGRTAYDPKVLLKVVLFAYSRGILHSRRMEKQCRENVTFMALACGQKPDHSTLAAFVSSMGEERIVSLFTQVLLVCDQEGLLGGTQFSMDGLKLPGNASKEWSGTHVELLKKKEKLQEKVKTAVKKHREEDRRGGDPDAARERQRIARLKRQVKRIERFLAGEKPKSGKSGKEIQSNVTDNESAKMVSSHGVVQGYNANALVDGKRQVVVHAQAFGEGEDASVVRPMLAAAENNLKAVVGEKEPLKNVQLSADTGYFSVENLEACRDAKVDAYIPDRQFRSRDPRFADARRHRRSVDKRKQRYKSKKRWFSVDDFKLNEKTGQLICPAGHRLYVKNKNFEVNGYRAIAYQAPKTACRNCTLRSKCLRCPNTVSRQVYVFYGRRPGSLTDAMKQKIDTVEGRAVYSRRMSTVEPVFGNVRAQKRMDRFTLRGRKKVTTQWMLYCMVHNIEKIQHYGENYAMAS